LNNLVVRTIAGAIFSALVIGSAFLGAWALGAIFCFFSSVALLEFYTITSSSFDVKPKKIAGILTGILIYGLVLFYQMERLEAAWFWLISAIVSVILSLELVKLSQRSILNVAITFTGWIYVSVPFAFVNVLAFHTGRFNYELPLGFFLILWTNDTGAYLTGKFLGKTKLYPSVSPNKTIEGLLGGVALSILCGWGLSKIFFAIGTIDWMVISAIIALFANVGDLFESHLKRICAVKDSGSIMPGHGGMLDRFDGLLLALPVVVLYLKLISSQL
jgi:phosphatidate cytidylyltransferase